MKYVSLFAGIGGFDLALNRLGHECVYANEWNTRCADIYERHFNKRPDTRDIRTVVASEIPDSELLVGGFPCPDFSIAGRRKGFDGEQGDLFFEICRIIETKRPTYLLLENVRGLLTHEKGKTFRTILRKLDELGYETEYALYYSTDFGVPQSRPRVYIRGTFRGGKDKLMLAKGLTKKHLYCLSARRGLEIRTITGKKLAECPPRLYERMQGFPLNWTEGLPKTVRKSQLGNAVTVNVVSEIIKRI